MGRHTETHAHTHAPTHTHTHTHTQREKEKEKRKRREREYIENTTDAAAPTDARPRVVLGRVERHLDALPLRGRQQMGQGAVRHDEKHVRRRVQRGAVVRGEEEGGGRDEKEA
jgi:hypothetical protein